MTDDVQRAIDEAKENGETVCHVDGDGQGALVHPNGNVGQRGAVSVDHEDGQCHESHGSAGGRSFDIAENSGTQGVAYSADSGYIVATTRDGVNHVIHPDSEELIENARVVDTLPSIDSDNPEVIGSARIEVPQADGTTGRFLVDRFSGVAAGIEEPVAPDRVVQPDIVPLSVEGLTTGPGGQ
ncbi:MAG: hypothetical protein AAF569_05775 [Pseudomonadota bacterium]